MTAIQIEQTSPRLGRFEDNFTHHVSLLAEACRNGTRVVVFPELSLTGYLLKDLVPEVAITARELLDHFRGAKEPIREIEALVGFAEESEGHRFFNSAAFLRWDAEGRVSLVHLHRKIYLPTYGLFDEARYYSPGRTVRSFKSEYLGRVGILICEDAWHLSTPLLLAVDGEHREGAGTLLIPSCSPARGISAQAGGVPESHQVWKNLLQTYASLLGTLVIYANRAGVEDGLTYAGGSKVIAPGGGLLAEAGYFDPQSLRLELEWPALLRRHRVVSPVHAADDLDLLRRELDRIFHRGMEDR
jgi:predicted amidohydrolase